MSNAGGKPVALSHMEGFSDLYIPVNCLPDFPKPLTELFDPKAMCFSYSEEM